MTGRGEPARTSDAASLARIDDLGREAASPSFASCDALPLREVLDGDLDRGTAVFDVDRTLAYANPAARAILHPTDVVPTLRDALEAHRIACLGATSAHPPRDLLLGAGGGRAKATISLLAQNGIIWYVVRFAPPRLFTTPTVRRLEARFRLTPREAQVSVAVAKGLTNGEVAVELGIREKTVKNSLVAVFLKVGVRDRVELAIHVHDGPADDGVEVAAGARRARL